MAFWPGLKFARFGLAHRRAGRWASGVSGSGLHNALLLNSRSSLLAQGPAETLELNLDTHNNSTTGDLLALLRLIEHLVAKRRQKSQPSCSHDRDRERITSKVSQLCLAEVGRIVHVYCHTMQGQ